MTKLRVPDSIEDACTQAKALIGADAIATALSAIGLRCSESLVDKWCDMDAAQTPSLAQALAMEGLLIKSGHAPIFSELFLRLLPRPRISAAEENEHPLRVAMKVTANAVELMEKVDVAMVDERIERHELTAIEKLTTRCQQHIARLRRAVQKRLAK